MWIFNKDGFFSAVQDRNDKSFVQVRARFVKDLNLLTRSLEEGELAFDTRIIETPDGDYPFRIVILKSVWATYLEGCAYDINYDNFKSSLSKEQHNLYLQVWGVMKRAQKKEPKTKVKKKKITKWEDQFI